VGFNVFDYVEISLENNLICKSSIALTNICKHQARRARTSEKCYEWEGDLGDC